MITEKENFIRTVTGKEPAWVPRNCNGVFRNKYTIDPPAVVPIRVSYLEKDRTKFGGKDMWGVEHITTKDTGWQSMPDPKKPLFTDIRKWRDFVKAPSLDGIDWEQMAAKDLSNVDRTQSAVRMGAGTFFQQLIGFLGFEEGLMAFIMEPEEIYAMFDYMANFYEIILKNILYYYKPDLFLLTDDTATGDNPFFSLDVFRELLKPFQKRLCDLALEAGIPVHVHDCGHCEAFIDDWIDLGITSWEPAQIMNDLKGIKQKYGNKFTLVGCWDSSGPAGWKTSSEELVRSEVRKCIDTYAPGGGFCFWASSYGEEEDPEFLRHAEWITDEYNKYGRTFYRKQG